MKKLVIVLITIFFMVVVTSLNTLALDLESSCYTYDNPYYNSGFGGQCTAFVWGRSCETTGISLQFNQKSYPSAKYWYLYGPIDDLNLSMGTTVQGNSIAIWEGDESNPFGHVAYVERVEGDTVFFNEANVDTYNGTTWGGGYDGYEKSRSVANFESRGTGVGNILGYIYLTPDDSEEDPEDDLPDPGSGNADISIGSVKISKAGENKFQHELTITAGDVFYLDIEVDVNNKENEDVKVDIYYYWDDDKKLNYTTEHLLGSDLDVDIDGDDDIKEHKRNIRAPTEPGTYYYYIYVVAPGDTDDSSETTSDEYGKLIVSDISLPVVTTVTPSSVTQTTALSGGNITSDGGAPVTARGVCWNTSAAPNINDSKTSDATNDGAFTSLITGLSAGTTYYVRAYATNSKGTAYGSEKIFTTEFGIPTVTTTTPLSITKTTALSGGNVTSDGGAPITARGICWNTSANPTTANNKTTDGTGLGGFISSITGLTANTTYYVRAYAINNTGTAYGNEEIFTTATGLSDENFILILTIDNPNTIVRTGESATIYGTAGTNHVTVESGAYVKLVHFPGNNTISIASNSEGFTVSRSGTIVTFEGEDGTVLRIPATQSTQIVEFTNSASLTLSIYDGEVMLDDQVVTTTANSIDSNSDDGGSEVTGECGAYVASGVWKEFDCYNLAAIGKTTGDDPFTPSWRLIGGYWQWGRKGPDESEWYDTNTPNFAHGPTGPDLADANDGVIDGWDTSYADDGAWSDSEKTDNDPCPSGYRMPTQAQWQGVLDNNTEKSFVGTWSNDVTNYSSGVFLGGNLMLPAAGLRYYGGNGSLISRGDFGYYWASTEHSSGSSSAWGLLFYSDFASAYNTGSRNCGFSVRCIAE